MNPTENTLLGGIKHHWKGILAGVVVLLLALAIILYTFNFRISKADYRAALVATNQATTAYNDLLASREALVEAVDESDAAFEAASEDFQSSIDDYVAATDAISTQRALGNDMVRAKYDALMKKNVAFERMLKSDTELFPLAHAVATDCSETALSKLNISDLGKIVEAYDSATADCVKAVDALSKSTDSDAAARGKAASDYFASMRAHAVAMQNAYTANDRTTFESEYNAFLEAVAKYRTMVRVDDLLAIDTSVTPTAELNQLATTLNTLQK